MAYEAVLTDRLENPIDFTCADGTGIEKGTVLKLTDPRTVSITDGNYDRLAGIAAREKVASDGRTRIAVYVRGIFDMYCSGAIVAGEAVASPGTAFPNWVIQAPVNASGSEILGYALETGSASEVIQVFVNVGCGGNSVA